ncbi:MAG: hypothetical protein MRERV_7c090 [Mycoplasmataceae bacterium RV_VA103A]|nr:MAG: hypothetical protein MRERV_7c090 [Mycoplasmataceae bacterium RV_VA103A]
MNNSNSCLIDIKLEIFASSNLEKGWNQIILS